MVADRSAVKPSLVDRWSDPGSDAAARMSATTDACEPLSTSPNRGDTNGRLTFKAHIIETGIDLGFFPEPVGLGDGHHWGLHQIGLHLSNEPTHRRLADLGTMLPNQTLPHTMRRVTLLPGHLEIVYQPIPDEIFPRTQHRSITLRSLAWRWHCIVDRLTHRTAMHIVGISQPANRRTITTLTTNLLEQFHPRHLPLPPR